MAMPAFTTNIFLPSKSNGPSPPTSRRSAFSVRCTAAPERTRTSQKSPSPQYFKVIPENLPVTERPPPPRHKSVPYVGFFIEYFLGRFQDGYRLSKKYGAIYLSNFFLAPMYYLSSYGATCEILKEDDLFRTNGAFPGMDGFLATMSFLWSMEKITRSHAQHWRPLSRRRYSRITCKISSSALRKPGNELKTR